MFKSQRRPTYELTLERSGFLDCVGGWTTRSKRYFINYRENIFVVDSWDGLPTVLGNSSPRMTIVAEFDSVEAAIVYVELEIANGN